MEPGRNRGFGPRRMAIGLVVLALSGCNKSLSTNADSGVAAPPWIHLLLPASARRVGASMPVQVSVALAAVDGSTPQATCVAVGADPGVLHPVFPTPCNAAGDGGGSGAATDPVQTCVKLDAGSGSTLALYVPAGSESVVTLVGGLYEDESCAGVPISTTAVVIDLSPPASPGPDGGSDSAPDGGAAGDDADTGPADAAMGDCSDGGDAGTACQP